MRSLFAVPVFTLLGAGIIVDNTTPPCSNGLRDRDETDVDCGGNSCSARCANGRRCTFNADCGSGTCLSGFCADKPTYQPRATPNPQSTTVYRIFPGAALSGVTPGTDIGYFITANQGGSYRLVWTGDAQQAGGVRRYFYGSVWTPGRFQSNAVVPGCNGNICPLETGDVVTQPQQVQGGQRIDFSAVATNGLDGFDFVVDTEPAIFDLYIDGQQYKELVFFPAADGNPPGRLATVGVFPYGLTTR